MSTGLIFGGGELSSFLPSSSAVVENTTASLFDPAYARCAIAPAAAGVSFDSAPWVNPGTNAIITSISGDVWFGFNLFLQAPISEAEFFSILNNSGTKVFKVTAGPAPGIGGTIRMYYWTGSAFAQVGAGFSIPSGILQQMRLHVSTTVAQMFYGGTLQDSGTATMTNVAALAKCRGTNPGNVIAFSEMMVADVSLVTYRLFTIPITGQGANASWTGAYTNINGAVTNDGSFVYAPTNGQITTYVHTATIPANIRAIVVSARANAGTAGPQNLDLAIRSGGVNYFSPDRLLGAGFSPNLGIWGSDPNTALAWTVNGAQNMEYGGKAVT